MKKLATGENVNDLEEVIRRNAKRAHQSILNRRRHLAETSLVVLSFEDVDLRDRHLHVLSKVWLHPTRCWPGAAVVSTREFARHDRSQQATQVRTALDSKDALKSRLCCGPSISRRKEALLASFGQVKVFGAAVRCGRFDPDQSVPLQRQNIPAEGGAIHHHVLG